VAFGESRGNTRAFAHAAVDAGAGLVLGSGPHVVRGIERYHHALIAYSLGNFAASHTLGLGGVLGDSAILSLEIDAKVRLLTGQWTSVHVNSPGVPVPDPDHRSLKIMRSVSRQDFGKRAIRATSSGRLLFGTP
jgi:Bacterial capsule synthesis protein PGA_cap